MIKAEGLFDELIGVPVRRVIPAVHLAVRILTHAAALQRTTGGLDPGFLAIDFSEADRRTAKELIESIEQQEGVSIGRLDASKTQEYIAMLAAVLYQLTAEEFPHNEARGNALMEQLRAA